MFSSYNGRWSAYARHDAVIVFNFVCCFVGTAAFSLDALFWVLFEIVQIAMMDDSYIASSVNVCVEAPAENLIQEIGYDGQEIYQL